MSTRALMVGHVTHDRYDADLVPGGCAFYGAQVLRQLGARVALVTRVGTDFGCVDAFEGLDVACERGGTTTLFTNEYPSGEKRVQRIEAQAPTVEPTLLPPLWRTAELCHLAPVMGEVELADWVAAVDAGFVGIGVQGWIKHAGAEETVVQKRWQVDAAALHGVDGVCVGEEDLVDQGDLLDRLCAAVPVVAFTHGAAGCDVIVGGKTTRVGVHPATEVDPTGAGDAFAAAFFLGLARGNSPVDAARLGAATASIVIEARGGESLGRVHEAPGRAAAIR